MQTTCSTTALLSGATNKFADDINEASKETDKAKAQIPNRKNKIIQRAKHFVCYSHLKQTFFNKIRSKYPPQNLRRN